MKRKEIFDHLSDTLAGEVRTDLISRIMYATDASAYRQMPDAVVYPKHKKDVARAVRFARKQGIAFTARGAGTSLAGQVVNGGMIVDYSRYFTQILDFRPDDRWIKVQPGIVLEELNQYLLKHNLFFGPETSTANRCIIGGMIGNNACGLHSLVYGSTRDHLLETEVILSDGTEATFGPVLREEFEEKCSLPGLEGDLYRHLQHTFSDPSLNKEIRTQFPDPAIPRRNTGYALDILLETDPFTHNGIPLNLSLLLAGSEGTLAQVVSAKLALTDPPPGHKALLCVHLTERTQAFKANLTALRHKPAAVEMMDRKILDLSKKNIEQRRNRFFIEGNPDALLLVEFAFNSRAETTSACKNLITDLQKEGYGYAYPVISGNDISRVWALRKAGLGVLSNIKGDHRPVSVIEDTAVRVEDLPAYMEEFELMMDTHQRECVYHAHIGTGELHLRPLLNLKDPKDVELFRTLARKTALLVKKYRGSLSGEHGDGRLRSEFIPLVVGNRNYKAMKALKNIWDPQEIFNPGVITGFRPMDSFLRYTGQTGERDIPTVQSFEDTGGILRAAEKCNGSGDCRKSELIGGTMCPSYMATRDEKHTTRARANVLREMLSRPENANPYDHPGIYEILDLCLSCKGCKSECPSGVDIAKMKAEFLQHWYDVHGVPLRSRMIAWITTFNRLGMILPAVYNYFLSEKHCSTLLKKTLGFAPARSIPLLHKKSFRRIAARTLPHLNPLHPKRRVYLFVDEFSNYNDVAIAMNTLRLLTGLGYEVVLPRHGLSGRTFISKGFLRKARSIAQENIRTLSPLISAETPLLGIEPSGILGFRDEYPDLAGPELKKESRNLQKNSYLIEEFLVREYQNGRIRKNAFRELPVSVLLHGHCQQKALTGTRATREMLSLIPGICVEEIPSGCCGMAGSFGYEKEHYELSMKVGELILFPAIRKAASGTIICAAGTSCRHQIKDGTGTRAMHPVEIMVKALI